MTPPAKKPRQPERNHPEDRARIEGSNTLARFVHGAPLTTPQVSYYTPLLIQCTLPHSDPKVRDWKKTNGDFTLYVSSGVDKNLVPYGIPYGSFPRLMLAHLITQVIATGERRIELTSRFSTYLKEVGYTGNLRGNSRQAKTLQGQMDKLLNSSIKWEGHRGTAQKGESAIGRVDVAARHGLWWEVKETDQETLFGSWVELTEEFYNSILKNPVPLHTDILAALKKSTLALDVYMWVSYRLYNMKEAGHEQISLTYGNLQEQFGSGISKDNYRKFRQELKIALAKVAAHWHPAGSDQSKLHYELTETELFLYRSPLLISKAKPKGAAEAERILGSRSFDVETRRKARVLAGDYSVDFLQEQYFKWVEAKKLTPKNPQAHFFTFIKAHRRRNGEKP